MGGVTTGNLPTFILIWKFELPLTIWITQINSPEPSINSYLAPRDKHALSKTCKSFHVLYKDEFSKQRNRINTLFNIRNNKPYDSENLHKLLSHAALGEWAQAEAIWSKDPSLLTRHGTVYHPNRIYQKGNAPIDIDSWVNLGRYKYVNCTAWQIALMNEEFEEAEYMGKMMTFDEMQRQFFEIFPTGNIENDSNKFAIAKKLLQAALVAITHDWAINENHLMIMNETTRNALRKLYDFVMPAPEHKSGLVFDTNIYMEARKLYEDNFDKLTQSQRLFWCIRIEEQIATVLGTSYLRLHALGASYAVTHIRGHNLDNIKIYMRWTMRHGCDLRKHSTWLGEYSSYFPFRRSSNSIPGLHHFVGSSGGVADARSAVTRTYEISLSCHKESNYLITYIKKKQEHGQRYAAVFAPSNLVSKLLK